MVLTQADKTNIIIKTFYDVYNELGYGFLENVYQNALYKEFLLRDIQCVVHPKINVYYKKEIVGYYVADIIAFDSVILELKSVSILTEAHELQLVNYLKATSIEVGLLLNFGPKPEFRRKVFSHYYQEHLQEENNKSALSVSSASKK